MAVSFAKKIVYSTKIKQINAQQITLDIKYLKKKVMLSNIETSRYSLRRRQCLQAIKTPAVYTEDC